MECKLYVRKVKLSPSVFIAHAKALEVGNAKYPVRRIVCKTFTVPAGNLNFTQENVFAGQLPTRVVVGMVDNDAFNGVYDKNPFNFKHYDLTSLKLYLDGHEAHSIKPIEMNFATHQYINGYLSLFSGVGKLRRDEGNEISRDDYVSGYTLFAFDLSPDLSEDKYFQLVKEGSVRLDVKFTNALPNTINVIIYAVFESIIEIDSNRNVLFDYTN